MPKIMNIFPDFTKNIELRINFYILSINLE